MGSLVTALGSSWAFTLPRASAVSLSVCFGLSPLYFQLPISRSVSFFLTSIIRVIFQLFVLPSALLLIFLPPPSEDEAPQSQNKQFFNRLGLTTKIGSTPLPSTPPPAPAKSRAPRAGPSPSLQGITFHRRLSDSCINFPFCPRSSGDKLSRRWQVVASGGKGHLQPRALDKFVVSTLLSLLLALSLSLPISISHFLAAFVLSLLLRLYLRHRHRLTFLFIIFYLALVPSYLAFSFNSSLPLSSFYPLLLYFCHLSHRFLLLLPHFPSLRPDTLIKFQYSLYRLLLS